MLQIHKRLLRVMAHAPTQPLWTNRRVWRSAVP